MQLDGLLVHLTHIHSNVRPLGFEETHVKAKIPFGVTSLRLSHCLTAVWTLVFLQLNSRTFQGHPRLGNPGFSPILVLLT
jgi:hypothetical protein